MPKLTKTFVEKVEPPASGHVVHWDGGHDRAVKGYGLRVSSRGRRVFIVAGRVQKRQLQYTIGPFGQFTEDEARSKARSILQQMRDGTDPRDTRRADEAMNVTLGDVCTSYVNRPGKLKQSTADEYQRFVDTVFAAWKGKPIVGIAEADVRKRHREMVDGGLDGKRAAPGSANAAFVTLRILMNYASRQYRRADGTPLIGNNPVNVLRDHWAPLKARTDRYIDRRKIGQVWNRLHEARAAPKNRDHLSAIDLTVFALLTGARRNEMAALTWDRVNINDDDPADCWWHLDDRKRGDPLWLPLSSQAVALLKERPRRKLPDGTDSPFVFASWGKNGHIADARSPMEQVSEIVGKHLSLHDCRRSFSNYAMRECRIGKFETDLLTGHKPAADDVTARAYLDLERLDWLYPEVQKIGDWIEQQGRLAAAQASGENVVALRA
jgi:integrase